MRDLVLMNVVAIISLRWIARGALIGPSSITLWIAAWLSFFVPLAFVISSLSRRFPEQGGVYVWVRQAFGRTHGFICGWCLWVNNLFYFPSLLLFGGANLALVFGERGESLLASRGYFVVAVLAGIWTTTIISIAGLGMGKWVQNAGSAGVWVPAGLLLWAGAVTLAGDGSATPFSGSALVPRGAAIETIGVWSAMCFAFSGFEITSLVGREVHDARRTIPLGIAIAGAVTTIFYIAGTAALLIAIPAHELRELSGIADAVSLVGQRLGVAGIGPLTGALLAAYALAGTASWTAGAARIPFAAGVDRVMPGTFGRLHPRFRTPHIALAIQGALSTGLFLVSLFLTSPGSRSNVQEAYDILVNLTILIYFIPYLYLFAAFIRLLDGTRRMSGVALAALGFVATAVSLALTFIPPAGANPVTYEATLVVQAAAILGIGVLFYRRSADRSDRVGAGRA